eukprot:63198-Amphidinium_carterae.1
MTALIVTRGAFVRQLSDGADTEVQQVRRRRDMCKQMSASSQLTLVGSSAEKRLNTKLES